MQLSVVALWLAVSIALGFGCSSKSDAPAAGKGTTEPEARPSVAGDSLGFCERARIMMTRRRACFPEDSSLKMGLDEIAELQSQAPSEAGPRRRVAVKCALILDGMMASQQPPNCPLDVTAGERSELEAFLAGWYGERTPAPTTGEPSLDAVLVALAAQRDAACACKDLGCLRTASKDLDKAASLPAAAPAVAVEAAAAMVDEVARCKQRLAFAR